MSWLHFPWEYPPAPVWSPPQAAVLWFSPQALWKYQPLCGCFPELQGSTPHFSLILVSAALFLTLFFLSLAGSILLFLEYLSTKVPVPWLWGSATSYSGSVWSWPEKAEPSTGYIWSLPTDAALADPPPPQHHQTPDTYRQYNVKRSFRNNCIFSYYTASTILIYLIIANTIFNFADFNLLPFHFLVVEYFD